MKLPLNFIGFESATNHSNSRINSQPVPTTIIINEEMAAAVKNVQKAAFGGGCFWGMEKWFRKEVPRTT